MKNPILFKFINFSKKNIIFLIFTPILINVFINFFEGSNLFLNYFRDYKILLIFGFNSIFYIYFAYLISYTFKINSLSLSIAYFLLSFFVLDNIFFLITKNFSFNTYTNLVFVIWLCLIFFKIKEKIKIFYLIIIYILMILINQHFFGLISDNLNYIELNTDVPVQWIKLATLISSENYFKTYTNNIIQGQGLLISYLQALIFRINFVFQEYSFVRLNSFLNITFTSLIFYDLNIRNKNKIFSFISLLFFLLNSEWLTYLFFDSLMLEGILNIFVVVFLLNLKKIMNKQYLKNNSVFFYLLFSSLLLSKQFVVLLIFTFSLYLLRKNKNAIYMFTLIFLDYFYQRIFNEDSVQFEYLKGTSSFELLKNLFSFNNFEIQNIYKIIEQILIDKPFTYILIVYYLLNIYRLLFDQKHKFNTFLNHTFVLFSLNIFFIIVLYLTYWKNFGIASSYRYILNLFYVLYISLVIYLDNIETDLNLK